MSAISAPASATQTTSAQKLCENGIKYIEIAKNFTENKRQNWKECNKEEYIAKLMKNDSQTSIFEILNDKIKIYFDIEKIPKENDKLIFDIVEKIIYEIVNKTHCVLCMNDISYILTENLHSYTHEGRSYHLILYNLSTSKHDIKDFINYYISNKFVGYEYIDASVYTYNRLFRAVNQKGVSRFGDGLNNDDVHKVIKYYDAGKGSSYNMPENEQIEHSIIQICDYNEYFIKCSLTLKYSERLKYRKATKNASQNKFSDGWRNKPTIKNTFIFNNTPATEAATIVSTAQQNATPSPVIPPRPTQQEPTQEQTSANKEKQIYNNFVALHVLFNISKPNHGFIKLIDDIIKYYEDNKTYNGYKMTSEQLEITADIIKQCITLN